MSLVIAFSGKKQSGKTTSGHFIMSLCMSKLSIAQSIDVDMDGNIIVSDLLGNKNYKGIYSPEKSIDNDYILQQVQSKLDPYIKLYSFADPLKQDICMGILGLSWDQCYGSDEQKNTLTDLKWENMPGYTGDQNGNMTARQVMEYVGTEIFRKMDTNVWASTTIRKIQKDRPKIAVIMDCRFPNEVDTIKSIGGYIIRLTRQPYESDHISENILNKETYDWNNFNFVIDNTDMSIYDQCVAIKSTLKEVLSL